MTKLYTLTIGLNDKVTLKQEVTTEQAIDLIFAAVGDCTIKEATGCYTMNYGKKTIEKSLFIEKLDFDEKFELFRVIKELKNKLNQESVIYEVNESKSVLL